MDREVWAQWQSAMFDELKVIGRRLRRIEDAMGLEDYEQTSSSGLWRCSVADCVERFQPGEHCKIHPDAVRLRFNRGVGWQTIT